VLRSSADATPRNRRVSFKSNLQESLKLLDTKPSFGWKVSHHINQERLIIVCHTEPDLRQHIGIRTRPKMHSINNLNVQNLFFPLHDEILFQGHGKSQT
jgi:hypothetical protein